MTEGTQAPLSVAVAVDPFFLRSALSALLKADDRFRVFMCAADEEPGACAAGVGAQVLLTSTPVDADACVVVLDNRGDRLSLVVDGECRDVPDEGLRSLYDRLVEELAGLTVGTAY